MIGFHDRGVVFVSEEPICGGPVTGFELFPLRRASPTFAVLTRAVF